MILRIRRWGVPLDDLVGLYEASGGIIFYKNKNIKDLTKVEKKEFMRMAQIVFQGPYASLNPYKTVADIVSEGIDNYKLFTGKARTERVLELLEMVGLSAEHLLRYPHEFFGGQRQRIGIARALSIEPDIIVCDEPISSLDVSIQAQVVNLLVGLQKKLGLTYLFISHDLSMIRYISSRIDVKDLGKIIELMPKGRFRQPMHPYTKVNAEGFVVQLGVFADRENANKLEARLAKAGVKHYTESVAAAGGEQTRVRAGPYPTREAAEQVREQLKGIGLAPCPVIARQ